jgi:hypothetical protein
MTTTRLTPLIGTTVRIDARYLIDATMNTAEVIAMGDGGTAWVRFPDGTENAFPVDSMDVVTATIHRPNRPARVVLTPAAKRVLSATETHTVDGTTYLPSHRAVFTEECDTLVTLGLLARHGDDITPHQLRYSITNNGQQLRGYLQHQFRLGQLAKQVRAEGITGEDIADVAAGIDAGEDTGSITGTSVDFQLAFALAASLSEQSAEDLRQDLETYLGWNH